MSPPNTTHTSTSTTHTSTSSSSTSLHSNQSDIGGGNSKRRTKHLSLEIATNKRPVSPSDTHQASAPHHLHGADTEMMMDLLTSSPMPTAMSCSTSTTTTTPQHGSINHHHHYNSNSVAWDPSAHDGGGVDVLAEWEAVDSDNVAGAGDRCCVADAVDIAEEGSRLSQWENILHMPDILTCVFYFMDRRELLTRIRPVCRQWNAVCSSCTLLWHHHTFADNPYYYYHHHRHRGPNPQDMVAAAMAAGEEPGMDSHQHHQQQQQHQHPIQVSCSAQLYPTDKTMWHDTGDSTAMNRRNLQGTWTFLNYKAYFIEQCLLDRCSITQAPDINNNVRFDMEASGADGTSFFSRNQGRRDNDKNDLGPMFLEDKHAMSCIEKHPTLQTYRHTLTVLPCTPESENVKYRGISRESFNTHYKDNDTIYNRKHSGRTLIDPRNPSDKVYFIGGLHNTMTTQPDELAEDYVKVIDIVDNDQRRSISAPSSSRPSAGTSNGSAPPSPIPLSSVSSPLVQGLRRLFNLGSATYSNAYLGIGLGGSNIPKRMSHFKHVKVTGKPPHIGKHTSVLFENVDINGLEGPKILIFGGVENDCVTNNLFHFDLNSNTWFLERFGESEMVPSPRTNHAAVAVDDYMYIIGGGIGPNMIPTSDIWCYHVHDHEWEQVHFTGDVDAFTPRLGVVVTVINHKILIYGGGYWHQTSMVDRYWREKYRDMYILDTDTNVITKIDQSHCPIAPLVGTFPASVLIGTQWYIVGGAYDNKISHDMYAFDTVTYKWRKFNRSFYGGDSLSCCHFVNNDQLNKLLILGGYCYTPLSQYQVFSLRYKDMMDAKHIFPTTTFYFHGKEEGEEQSIHNGSSEH